jgi:hypothetical protein
VSEKEYVNAMSAAVVQRLVREFCALDADDDGKVRPRKPENLQTPSRHEFRKSLLNPHPAPSPRGSQVQILDLKTHKTVGKQVTYSELRAWLFGSGGWDEREVGELMELLDMDHDGAVTLDEYIEAMSSRGGGAVFDKEEEEEEEDREGVEEGGDVGVQLARMFEADDGEEGEAQREIERVAREERKRQRWDATQALLARHSIRTFNLNSKNFAILT